MKRRFLTGLLACTMAVSMFGATAFAANITIDGTATSYEAYRILDLTTTLKADCGHTEGQDHTDACYVYDYTVPAKYGEALRTAATNASLDFDVSKDGTVSDRELIDGIEKLDATGIRTYADALYDTVVTPMDADLTTSDKSFSGAPQGYYLIYESGTAASPDSRSLIMLNTAGQSDITVTSKEDVPTVVKKIVEDGNKVDAVDANEGDIVVFETTVTMPDNIANYEDYSFTIHDKATGLTLLEDGKNISDGHPNLGVYVDGKAVTLGTGSSVTRGGADGCLFEMTIQGLTNAEGAAVTLTKDSVITVEYACTASAQFVKPNETWLVFDNDPYADGTSETPKDKTAVFTFVPTVHKTDSNGQALAGAEFTLTNQDTGETVTLNTTASGANPTDFTFSGIKTGTYVLSETKVPEGYSKAADVTFEIKAEYPTESADPALTSLKVYQNGEEVTDGTFTISSVNGTIETTVVNNRGVRLPGTGMDTLVKILGIGGVLVIGSGIVLIAMKKKKAV